MCHRYIKGLEFKSRVPLNKASTTCTKNDSSGLQSICFSANNFSSISFNNSGLGSDLTNSQLKAHVSIPWGKYGKEAKTEIHKCTYFASTLFLSEIIYRTWNASTQNGTKIYKGGREHTSNVLNASTAKSSISSRLLSYTISFCTPIQIEIHIQPEQFFM